MQRAMPSGKRGSTGSGITAGASSNGRDIHLPSSLHCREDGRGSLEMAVFLDFLHFQLGGLEMIFSGLV